MYQMIATLAAGNRMPAHSHAQEQVVHILEGRMRLIVDGVPHELSAGDCSISRATFRMVSKRYYRHACSIPSVLRGTITWRLMRRFATARCRSEPDVVVEVKSSEKQMSKETNGIPKADNVIFGDNQVLLAEK